MAATAFAELAATEHLDWHDIECGSDDCSDPATWWLVCLDCRKHLPWCDRCRRMELSFAPMFARVACRGCGAGVRGDRFASLFTVVPIGGAS